MAYAKISLTDGVEVKVAPVGYSWTMFFFGGWPPIFRQDWIWGVLLILACLATYGIAGIVCSFFYNKAYINNLLNKGYKVNSLGALTPEALNSYLGRVSVPVV